MKSKISKTPPSFFRHFHRPLAGLFIPVLVLLCTSGSPIQSKKNAIVSYSALAQPVIGQKYMVATQNALATKVGYDILKAGGNAVDAAVAVGFALAVSLPRAGNIGGGGFMLVHLAKTGKTIAIDYREKAPAVAHKDMYLDNKGNVDGFSYTWSYKAVGVPGTVKGLTHALAKYGTMPLAKVIEPAIKLAEKGFVVDWDLAQSLARVKPYMQKHKESMAVFYKNGTKPYAVGETLRQPDLAASLKAIKRNGASAFYDKDGSIAKQLVAAIKKGGGIITAEDLAAYNIKERPVIEGSYRGYSIRSMPPPSSGGVHLVQMLNMLEAFDLKKTGFASAETIRTYAEVMKRAYADRSKYLGDPDAFELPVTKLISKDYARRLVAEIKKTRVTPSSKIAPSLGRFYESDETTHYSVVDKDGNAVSNTYTLNFSYGMMAVAGGTGILLNNEMNDFSAKPGVPNAYGLIGGKYNAVGPGRRMLSSMSPTIVLKDGKLFLVTGSPGGSRIITTVLQLIVNMIDFDMNVAEATAAPRVHHQWLPDEIRIERNFNADTAALLKKFGYTLKEKSAMGSTQSIAVRDGVYFGYSDPRKAGSLTLGD